MSRKDMRVASGRLSDSSSEDSDAYSSDSNHSRKTSADASAMKPPNSPDALARRQSGRPRTKSFPAQSAEATPLSMPSTRRRSSSLRGMSEQVLPSVEEKDEDSVEVANKIRQNAEVEAKYVLEEAQRLEAKRQEDEMAESEARRKEEEAAKERKAEEDRREEERKRQEEARIAEEARQAEEIRRKEIEFAEAKQRAREQVFASLPYPLARVLEAGDGFELGTWAANLFVLKHFAPLQAIRMHSSALAYEPGSADELYVLNAQAAAFLGEVGWEILLPHDSPYAVGLLERQWQATPATAESVKTCLAKWQQWQPNLLCPELEDEEMEDDLIFSEELNRVAQRVNAYRSAQQTLLRNEHIALRWIRLEDVMTAAHPSLQSLAVEVCAGPGDDAMATKPQQGTFIDQLKTSHGSNNPGHIWQNGLLKNTVVQHGRGIVQDIVVHEK